jgi:ABC-2 type transport system permease protein
MPLLTAIGFSFMPLSGAFIMIVIRDPDLARRMGMISVKAQIAAQTADWSTYLNFLAQGIAVGGVMVFGLIISWVFGREYTDHTIKDVLALPTPRSSVVMAKLIVITLWALALTVLVMLVGFAVGSLIRLPPTSSQVMMRDGIVLAVTALLTIAVALPFSFFASAGHGYLPPMGAILATVVVTQIITWAGWGEFFPWAVPALYAGLGTVSSGHLGAMSYMLAMLICLVGIVATLLWWQRADQTQ